MFYIHDTCLHRCYILIQGFNCFYYIDFSVNIFYENRNLIIHTMNVFYCTVKLLYCEVVIYENIFV